ncbi:MAG: hypothetical protein Q4C65_08675 [Eubacteriales bacterium]|nr:hypothetical protein [Eubacteriales bacterium]
MKKVKKLVSILTVSVFCLMLAACQSNAGVKESDAVVTIESNAAAIEDTTETGKNAEHDMENDSEERITICKMQEMIEEIGLENAIVYGEAGEDVLKDQIVLLCESSSGRYKAYGFISQEYGRDGILIDNIIDGESNHNYFIQKWVYSEEQPTLNESDDFYQVTFTICQDQAEGMKEVLLDTYDTGTMDNTEGWSKMQ